MDISPIRFRVNTRGEDDVRSANELAVFHAEVIDGALYIYTTLSFYPRFGYQSFSNHNFAYFLKNDAVWDRYIGDVNFEEIANDINYSMNISLWENDAAKHSRELFDYIKGVCEPAYSINALGYDQERDEIYSEGRNSFLYKTHSIEERVTLIKNVKLGTKYMPLVGGFPGMERVRLFDSESMTEFVNKFNTVFH